MYYRYIAGAISKDCSCLMQDLIQKIRATRKHKKWQFSSKKRSFFLFWSILKQKTALSTFTAFQESSLRKCAHILSSLSCDIVVEIFVISEVFNVICLSMGWPRFLLRLFIWIWIDALNKPSGFKIIILSNVYWH